MKIKNTLIIFLAIILSIIILETDITSAKTQEPIEAYRVYVEGKSIGLIKSKEELDKYINEEQQELKEKYNVDKVYIPNDINVVKELTFDTKLDDVKDIYNKIKDIKPFTVKGYKVTIPQEIQNEDTLEISKKEIIFYILDKNILIESIQKIITTFIPEDKYTSFINQEQEEIVDYGTYIEDIYIENQSNMTIKETNISSTEDIIQKEDVLTKFLLFGTTKELKTYIVQENDTVEDIAYNNQMSNEEFLIANPSLTSVDTLLYKGQELTVGILSPIINVVEEKEVIKEENVNYTTEYQYDNNYMTGYSKTIQTGSNGTNKVTQKIKSINGDIIGAVIAKNEIIKPVVNEIILKGGRQPAIINAGNWAWPTNIPYIISDYFGYGRGRLHAGIDICGTGYGSPIYAAKSGTVVKVSYHSNMGYYIIIDHHDGYYTIYEHLANRSRYVYEGKYVTIGSTIGDMGSTGYSTGTHLHFGISYGYPYGDNYYFINPFRFY